MDLNLICSSCGVVFSSDKSLQIHIKCVHDTDKTELTCSTCGKKLVLKTKLLNHQAIHKAVECKFCGECISQNSISSHNEKYHV